MKKYRAFQEALHHYLSVKKDGSNIAKTGENKTQQHLIFTHKQ